jgi:hypothetical protein
MARCHLLIPNADGNNSLFDAIYVSQVGKKVVMTMESSRTRKVARSTCVYEYQLATQVE